MLGLPVEYLNSLVATRLGKIVGRVIHVDDDGGNPRNIRFLKVRVNINPLLPLIAGCTVQMDDDVR